MGDMTADTHTSKHTPKVKTITSQIIPINFGSEASILSELSIYQNTIGNREFLVSPALISNFNVHKSVGLSHVKSKILT